MKSLWLFLALFALPQYLMAEDEAPSTSELESQGKGELKFVNHSHDFGRVARGQTLERVFEFENVGQGALTIHGVHVACGCTLADVEAGKVYQPGDKGRIGVKLDTTSFRGPIQKIATVMTNERLLPDRTLTLKADVQDEFFAEPPIVDVGEVEWDTTASRTVELKSVNGFKLSVKGTRIDGNRWHVEYAQNGENWLVTVTLKPQHQVATIKDTLYVLTNSTALPSLPIPLRATVRGKIKLSANYLEFGAVDPGEKSRRLIQLEGLGEDKIVGSRIELHINGEPVKTIEPFVQLEGAEDTGKFAQMEFKLLNPSQGSGSVHGKVFIETSNPNQKELAVDFYAFFR